MSGVPAPLFPIVEPFGTDAVVGDDVTLPIPVPTQVGVLVGAASFADGFPAATRTDPEAGGVPPYGQDMNGILYMLSVYAATMQAGQLVPWNADAATAFGGYKVGARLASVAVPGLYFTNNLDGNATDPDVSVANWIASRPLFRTTAPAAGAFQNIVLPGPSDYVWDVDTAAGNVDFGGFVAQRDGQKLYISNTGANLFQALANAAGSAAANRTRAAFDLALVQNQTVTLQYAAGAPGGGKWLLV